MGIGTHLTLRQLTHDSGADHPWQDGNARAPRGCVLLATGHSPQDSHRYCLWVAVGYKTKDETRCLSCLQVQWTTARIPVTMYLLLESAPEPSHVHRQAGGGQHRASKGASGQGLTSQAEPAAGGPHHSHPLGGCRPHAE